MNSGDWDFYSEWNRKLGGGMIWLTFEQNHPGWFVRQCRGTSRELTTQPWCEMMAAWTDGSGSWGKDNPRDTLKCADRWDIGCERGGRIQRTPRFLTWATEKVKLSFPEIKKTVEVRNWGGGRAGAQFWGDRVWAVDSWLCNSNSGWSTGLVIQTWESLTLKGRDNSVSSVDRKEKHPKEWLSGTPTWRSWEMRRNQDKWSRWPVRQPGKPGKRGVPEARRTECRQKDEVRAVKGCL